MNRATCHKACQVVDLLRARGCFQSRISRIESISPESPFRCDKRRSDEELDSVLLSAEYVRPNRELVLESSHRPHTSHSQNAACTLRDRESFGREFPRPPLFLGEKIRMKT